MALEVDDVERMMEWLADGSPVRSQYVEAGVLVEKLTALLFPGEPDWPSRKDQADAYRDTLTGWFAGDSALESSFADLIRPDADPGVFVSWFARLVEEREAAAAATGFPNPNSDGTPGTAWYRVDESTGEYLYAASAEGPDWAAYEQRRYAPPSRDDGYGLDCRYDWRDGVYEWYDPESGTWRSQDWADRQVAARTTPEAGDGAAASDAYWDENWRMFYRVGPSGVYEYADAVTPGDESSGCGGVWLSHEQVLMAGARAAEPRLAEHVESLQNQLLAAAGAVFADRPDLAEVLSDEDIRAVLEDVARQIVNPAA